MNLGVIVNIITNKPEGIIGFDKNNKNVGYATNNIELESVIETILDGGKLKLEVKENIDNNEIIRAEIIDPSHSYYLIAFNYYLPFPWKILALRYVDGELEDVIKEAFEYMEEIENE